MRGVGRTLAAMRVTKQALGAGATALLLSAGAAPAGAATAIHVRAGHYAGRTSQHHAVSAVAGRGRIKRLKITWNAKCHTGAVLRGLTTTQRRIHVNRRGRWETLGVYTAPSGNGYTEHFRVTQVGFFHRNHRAVASFIGKVRVVSDATGQQVDTCSSGNVTYHLHRG